MTSKSTASVVSLNQLLGSSAEPDPQPIDTIAGQPERRYAAFEAGDLDVGAWTSTTGSWSEAPQDGDEIAFVIKGHLRLHPSDGAPIDVRAGDLLHVPDGWTGTWEILDPIEKVYVVIT